MDNDHLDSKRRRFSKWLQSKTEPEDSPPARTPLHRGDSVKLQSQLSVAGKKTDPDQTQLRKYRDRSNSRTAKPATPSTAEHGRSASAWDDAYSALKKKEPDLIRNFNNLLSVEIADLPAGKDGPAPGSGTPSGTAQLDRQEPVTQDQMRMIIERGLKRMDEKKTSYRIAGHEFVLQDQVAQATRFVLELKDWIGEAVKDVPQASMVWAGICIILPLLTNPSAVQQANSDGFTYVTTKMRFYVAFEPLLLLQSGKEALPGPLLEAFRSHMVDMYKEILNFQIRSVLRFFRGRLKNIVRDAVNYDDWAEMLSSIKNYELIVKREAQQITNTTSRQIFSELESTAKETQRLLESMLSEQLHVTKEQRDIAEKQLLVHKEELELVRTFLNERQSACLYLFFLTPPYDYYKDRIDNALENTGLWLLGHPKYASWLEASEGPLFIFADPGCGKSVLCKHLIDKELPKYGTVCYFFFKDGMQDSLKQALCAILHQLLSQNPILLEYAIEAYAKFGSHLIDTNSVLWGTLESMVRDPDSGPIVIVLDALDECRADDRESLMKLIRNYFLTDELRTGKLRLVCTSRPYADIMSGPQMSRLKLKFPLSRIAGEEGDSSISRDISAVIQHRVNVFGERHELKPEVSNHLFHRLAKFQHRTYLWAELVFNHLDHQTFKKTTRGVDALMEDLPQTTIDAYKAILLKSRDQELARKSFGILLAAQRPLSLREMNVAVNISSKSTSIEDLDLEDDDDFKIRLRDCCGLFITVYDGKVDFLHHTVKDFLLDATSKPVSPKQIISWHGSFKMEDAHRVMADVCVRYLAFQDFRDGLPQRLSFDRDIFFSLLSDDEIYPFSLYASTTWYVHVRRCGKVDARLQAAYKQLCDPSDVVCQMWYDVESKTKVWTSDIRPALESMTILALQAYLGHQQSVEEIIRQGSAAIEAVPPRGGLTPLYAACLGRHFDMARLLLKAGASPNCKWGGLTLAHYYFSQPGIRPWPELFALLLDKGLDVHARDHDRRTPLHLVSDRETMLILLKHGADVEARDSYRQTPLFLADDIELIRILLERGASPTTTDDFLWTPLHRNRTAAGFALLIQHGGSVRAKDRSGDTPLSFADDSQALRVLLAHGADPNMKNLEGQAYLHSVKAADNVRVLAEHGANLNIEDPGGERPLHKSNDSDICTTLLRLGASVNARNKLGRTPLMCCSAAQREKAATLLDGGADVNAADTSGKTALHFACTTYQTNSELITLLLQRGADPNLQDQNGNSPLHELPRLFAPVRNVSGVVEALVQHGARRDLKNRDGKTPLDIAAERYDQRMVEACS